MTEYQPSSVTPLHESGPATSADTGGRVTAIPVVGLGVWPRRLVVLSAGSATMAMQISAMRLLAPVVGGSTVVFATVIGLSLLAMSCGYMTGGRVADRHPDGRMLGGLLFAAAVLVAGIPLVSGPVLGIATLGLDGPVASVLAGSAVGYLALFAMPATLLGTAVPFAIRLAVTDIGSIGGTAGRLYALSTVGSIAGTLFSALVLLQVIGTRNTLWAISAVIAVAGATACARGRREVAVSSADGIDSPPLARRPHTRAGATAGGLGMGAASLVIVIEGVATMASEMSAARLLAPYFGAGMIVWANIIAVVMAAIALGAWAGGRLADRQPSVRALAWLTFSAAVAVMLLPFVARPVMDASAGGVAGTILGSFMASLGLLAIPMLLLGMMPPLVIRLAARDREHAGHAVGRLYALSTAGALAGTFGSVLVGIPVLGTPAMLVLIGGLLLATSWTLADLRAAYRVASGAFAGILLYLVLSQPYGPDPGGGRSILFQGESRYQFVKVVEDQRGVRMLQLNEGRAIHSALVPNSVLSFGIWDSFLLLPTLTAREDWNSSRLLVLGNAAGSAARSYRGAWPQVEVTGVEIDSLVTEAGREYFQLDESGQKVITADARPFLEHSLRQWDLIHIDAYRQPYIPFYLATREFFASARRHVPHGGVVSVNVAGPAGSDEIHRAIAATMRAEFPLVLRYRASKGNELIVAVDEPGLGATQLRERIRHRMSKPLGRLDSLGESPKHTRALFEGFVHRATPVQPARTRVLTDDLAPVEWIVDRGMFSRGCMICMGV